MACSLIVHAGSGRELPEIIEFCKSTSSTLIELSTGSVLENTPQSFPVVICPNTNILMLKFMKMVQTTGPFYSGYNIQVIESHQSGKKSTPGTAVAIASSLGLSPDVVTSIRDPHTQASLLRIAPEDLNRHALHQIIIRDGGSQISLETRVHGDAPYAAGVSKIVLATLSHCLENRTYWIDEYIESGWI